MRTTIDLPDPLLRRVKARAALDGITLKELLRRFVEQGLRGMSPSSEDPANRARSELPLARRATGVTIPAISNRELHRILDDEETEVPR